MPSPVSPGMATLGALMHLQQTKVESRSSGGPQYYFHDIPEYVKMYLRKHKACPVVLQTPYGLAKSPFVAVDRDHKLGKDGKPIPGKVGHDRIQQGSSEQSIGEEIRYWYNLDEGTDFERVDVEAIIHPEGHFILVPTQVKMRGQTRSKVIEKIHNPLSFHKDYQSKLWRKQIESRSKESPGELRWAADQIRRIVAGHYREGAKNILESDLLRAAGALSMIGMQLSPYLAKGYDCIDSTFVFKSLPQYSCPVEIKNRSRGFNYQITKYTKLPRAVVLCMEHNLVNPPEHIDIIELTVLADSLSTS